MSSQKHSLYLNNSKTKKVFNPNQPLNEYELFILNDVLDMEENDEEERNQNNQLPFDYHKGNAGDKRRQRVLLKKKNKSIAQKLQNRVNQMQQKIRGMIKSNKKDNSKINDSFIISPDSSSKLLWDLLCMALIFYEIISIPFKISFDVEIDENWDRFVDAVFIFDILVSFNTAYYYKGILVYNRKKIAVNYLKGWFWLDILASFPYTDLLNLVLFDGDEENLSESEKQASQIASSAQLLRLLKFIRFIKVIRLVRLAKLKVIFDQIDDFLQLSTTLAAILSFLQLSMLVLFWSHWLGCIYHYVAINETGETWLTINNLDDKHYWVRYVNSIYWAVTTMNTVGYGDNSPQTPIERLCGIFFLLLACGVFSFTMNTIGAALQQIDQKKQDYRKRMSNINNYMKKNRIPSQLQNRIRKYLAYIWDSDHPVSLNLITANLCQQLKYEFTIQVNGTILANCHFLCETFSRQMLTELTQIFKEKTILPDEFIFKEKEIENEEKHMYFIQEGYVNIVMQKTKQTVARLEKNDYFGEIAFFTNMDRTASARSIFFTDLFYLDRSEFLELLRKYQSDLEKFAQIRDDIVYKNDFSSLNLVCYGCLRDDHVVADCPIIHFCVNKQMYIKVRNRAKASMMKQFVRSDNISFNARLHMPIYQKAAIKLKDFTDFLNQKEECNLQLNQNDNDEAKLYFHQARLGPIGIINSKFRQERQEKREMLRHYKKQQVKIEKLEEIQDFTAKMFSKLGQLLEGNEEAMSPVRDKMNAYFERQKKYADASDDIPKFLSEDFSSSEDSIHSQEVNDIAETRFQQILEQYTEEQRQLEELINQNNDQQDKIKEFMLIPEFEKGASFYYYQSQNNMDAVIKEFMSIQRVGEEFRARWDTEYDDQVFNDLVDFYELDMRFFEIKKDIPDEKLRTHLSYRDRRRFEMKRQTKKMHNLMKIPEAVKKVKKGINMIKALHRMGALKNVDKDLTFGQK